MEFVFLIHDLVGLNSFMEEFSGHLLGFICIMLIGFILLFIRKSFRLKKFKKQIEQKEVYLEKTKDENKKGKRNSKTIEDELALWQEGHVHETGKRNNS
ncbi:MAG: hypothetical protein J7K00_00310 [Candidatus Diapherotrites archaeon]|nr:hypothetical protein [Candidatus Diapherotrites archaeon]